VLLVGRGDSDFVAWWEIDRYLMQIEDFMPDGVLDEQQGNGSRCGAAGSIKASQVRDGLRNPEGIGNEYELTNVVLGGRNELRVTAAATGRITTLQGELLSATVEGAIFQIRKIVDEFLGAMMAARLCYFVSAWLGHDSTVATVRIDDGGWRTNNFERFAFFPRYTDRLRGTRFSLPPDLTELEKHVHAAGDVTKALDRQLRFVTKVLAGNSSRAAEIRNACRLAVDAADGDEFGVAITLAFACLEGLLLARTTKDEVLGRLSEAVAHSLGHTFDERASLRKQVKRLYEARSGFVHTGRATEEGRARDHALDLMFRVIWREGAALPEPESESQSDAGSPVCSHIFLHAAASSLPVGAYRAAPASTMRISGNVEWCATPLFVLAAFSSLNDLAGAPNRRTFHASMQR
jgi:hypothetical protein